MTRLIAILLTSAALAVANGAMAQEAPTTTGALIGRLFDAAHLRKTPAPAADFVRQSRRDQLDYRPFDPTPEREDKAKTAARLQAISAQLQAAGAANRARAAHVGAPDAPAPRPRRK